MNWIQGDHFKLLADFTYSPETKKNDDYDRLSNTLDLSKVVNGSIIYTHTMYYRSLLQILKSIDKKVILITHNSDDCVDVEDIPDTIIAWYTTNVNTVNSRLFSIPIGLENNRWFSKIRKLEKIQMLLTTRKVYKNIVYVNHNVATFPSIRISAYKYFEDKSWATVEHGQNGNNFDTYLSNLYNHTFMICPRGNGIDTHRTWECLYMGTIPIELKNLNNMHYQDLPICFVDSWEQVTEDFLEQEYTRIKHRNWNFNKLTMKYWRDRIYESRNYL